MPNSWFGGLYKDNKPENFFAQFGTDPDEFPKVYPEMQMPPEQLAAWQRDRAGVIVNDELARKFGWKLGIASCCMGTIYPVNLELTIRGIYHWPTANKTVYFNAKYVEEAVALFKGQAGTFSIMSASPDDVAKIAGAVDDMFRNSPQPTKTESEKAFGLQLRQHAGQREGFYSQHLHGGGLYYASGLRQHHGDVDSREDARSGRAEDPGLRAADDSRAFCGRGHVAFDCGRAFWLRFCVAAAERS